ncbi:MAG: hypothetical protein IKI75_09395 [Lachnospiraceae bacterium]|nr:hypothetical protein [Lachnospiraceae bacterium]
MDVKCDFCNGYFDDQQENCPFCGAPNNHIRRNSDQIPKTIEELKQFCAQKNVPVKQMHFYIGENYTGPKAFGIYRDGDRVVVYKNKSDGSRAVRYEGEDEAYAVNEIYQKMRSEYASHKAANSSGQNAPRRSGGNRNKKSGGGGGGIAILVIVAIFIVICIACADKSGYYRYDDDLYYSQGSDWYLYDTVMDKWIPSSRPLDNMDDYYESYSYSSDYDAEDFSDSVYYDSFWDSDSDSSSSYDDDDWDDWDSGSDWDWDSGSDWDSDW